MEVVNPQAHEVRVARQVESHVGGSSWQEHMLNCELINHVMYATIALKAPMNMI